MLASMANSIYTATMPQSSLSHSIHELLSRRDGRSVVTISGPTAAGKSTLAGATHDIFNDSVIVHTDDYYYDDDDMPDEVILGDEIDYDHPHAVQLGRVAQDLSSLMAGLPVLKPAHRQPHRLEAIMPRQLIIVEGLVANHPTIRALSQLAILVTAPAQVRLERRIDRDFARYRRSSAATTRIFNEFAEPAYHAYHATNDATADVIIESSE